MPNKLYKIENNRLVNTLKENKDALFLVLDINGYSKGDLLNDYVIKEDGIYMNDKKLLESSYVRLDEKLSPDDEKRVVEIIRKQLKQLFWSLYTKGNMLI